MSGLGWPCFPEDVTPSRDLTGRRNRKHFACSGAQGKVETGERQRLQMSQMPNSLTPMLREGGTDCA